MIPKKLPPIETVQDVGDYAQRLEKCAKSCSYFAVQFLNLDVFDYNKAFLDCMDRFIVYRTGRQVGKSRNAAIKAIHFGYFAPLFASNLDEGECNVVIASLSKDQAYLIFKKIRNFIHKSPTLTKAIVNETKTEMSIEWFDGSGITNFIVRPIGDTGDSLRGFTAHFAILDEAAYIPQAVYNAFFPSTVTTKPHILLTSTPKGKAGPALPFGVEVKSICGFVVTVLGKNALYTACGIYAASSNIAKWAVNPLNESPVSPIGLTIKFVIPLPSNHSMDISVFVSLTIALVSVGDL